MLVVGLIERARHRLVEVRQLRKAATGVPWTIREGFGRESRADRDYKLSIARGEAEEAIGCLRTNYQLNRLTRPQYQPLHNRYVTIVKMLDSLMNS